MMHRYSSLLLEKNWFMMVLIKIVMVQIWNSLLPLEPKYLWHQSRRIVFVLGRENDDHSQMPLDTLQRIELNNYSEEDMAVPLMTEVVFCVGEMM